ncbi:MAG: hypothetical protein HW401_375 [Parcubacteria group bacterium]|nr:hypothetical protein [Parcubacteria group bacterium]
MKIAGLKIREIPISTRYFPEASMIGFVKSTKYGISILNVLKKYILYKFRLTNYKQFNVR